MAHPLGAASYSLPAEDQFLIQHLTHLFIGTSTLSKYRTSLMHLSTMDFAYSYSFWYVFFHVHAVFVVVSFLKGLDNSAVDGEYLPR